MYTIITSQAYHNKCCQSEHCSNKQMVRCLWWWRWGWWHKYYIYIHRAHVRTSKIIAPLVSHSSSSAGGTCAFSWVHSMLSECMHVCFLFRQQRTCWFIEPSSSAAAIAADAFLSRTLHIYWEFWFIFITSASVHAFIHMNSVQYFRCMQFAV